MTTVKKFEHEKQEIINEATKIINGFGVGILDRLADIVNKTMQLQPPRPTCSSCKQYTLQYINSGTCSRKVDTYDEKSESPQRFVEHNFNCAWHSDYESHDE
jgi:hypothetical protein